ncbi:hypothetical protein L1987_03229 [Smallanthus sonchifolius]|uniref:Uncharacterized protein n=1 Tax=Smallanthus sonchifolius TaxID=185202 RepID=A0ACB9KA44_9ASTR|nr:hypothetical protein L1987_03229 [Smallanthus sonchifolius]
MAKAKTVKKTVMEVGERLGYSMKKMKDVVVGLVKGRVMVLAKVMEVVAELLVEMMVVDGVDGFSEVKKINLLFKINVTDAFADPTFQEGVERHPAVDRGTDQWCEVAGHFEAKIGWIYHSCGGPSDLSTFDGSCIILLQIVFTPTFG